MEPERAVRYDAPAYGSQVPRRAAALGDGRSRGARLGQRRSACPPMDSYVVFLVDGLGWNLLRAHAAEAPYLAGLLGDDP